MIEVRAFTRTQRFEDELKAAPEDAQRAAAEALDLLMRNSKAGRLRCHPLSGYGKPTIYKIDVYANHSWQITFELVGTTAHLKRLATHKSIDRDPRG